MLRRLVACSPAALLFCVPTLAHAAWETKQLGGMSVEIYTPAGQSPIGSGRALMVGLHGCTQTAVQLRDNAGLETAADEFGMVIALPLVPNGGVIAGCWNYYGGVHTRMSGDNGHVIPMTEALRDDAAYGIDPAQIYLAGFSAGGGQALVLGCLAPDLFAGVGVAAGPSLGTSVSQIPQVSTTAEQAATLCTQLAGTHSGDFATQLAVTFTDTGDYTVAQGYAQVSADMFAIVYGGGLGTAPFDMASLPGTAPAGMGTEYDDADGGRIATMVSTSGVGHNWPAGTGTAGPPLSYVAGNGLDFASYLAEFFTANSRRAEGEWNPGDDSGGSDDGATSAGDDGSEGADASDDGGSDEDGSDAAGDDSEGGDEGDGDASATAGISGGGESGPGYVEPSGCQCSADASRRWPGLAWLVLLGALRRRRLTA